MILEKLAEVALLGVLAHHAARDERGRAVLLVVVAHPEDANQIGIVEAAQDAGLVLEVRPKKCCNIDQTCECEKPKICGRHEMSDRIMQMCRQCSLHLVLIRNAARHLHF